MNISVIGLGKLGCPLAAWIASKGHNVTGIDVNQGFVDKINQGRAPVDEPGLQELVTQVTTVPGWLHATTEHRKAILDTDITFIVVPTPSIKTGEFTIKWVKQAAKQIGLALNYKDTYHLVVITSTVMPGHSQVIADAIGSYSGKKCGEEYGVCYNPEFIALGSVLKDLSYPDFVLIGQSDDKAGGELEVFYRGGMEIGGVHESWIGGVPIYRTSFINAEIAKLALNCFVTMKISFANMIGRVCEHIPGADADEVTGAIGRDSRIGKKYLKAGTPFGGPCFPRDNEAFMAIMDRTQMSLPMATKAENMLTLARIDNAVIEYSRIGDTIGIVGMAYKLGTAVMDESAGIKLLNALKKSTRKVLVWESFHESEAQLCGMIERSDVVVVMLPCEIDWSKCSLEGKVIIDPWRCVDSDTLPDDCVYVPMGRHSCDG